MKLAEIKGKGAVLAGMLRTTRLGTLRTVFETTTLVAEATTFACDQNLGASASSHPEAQNMFNVLAFQLSLLMPRSMSSCESWPYARQCLSQINTFSMLRSLSPHFVIEAPSWIRIKCRRGGKSSLVQCHITYVSCGSGIAAAVFHAPAPTLRHPRSSCWSCSVCHLSLVGQTIP